MWAQAELRKTLAAAGAKPLDEELPVGQAAEQFDAAGRLVDDDVRQALEAQLGQLRRAAPAAA